MTRFAHMRRQFLRHVVPATAVLISGVAVSQISSGTATAWSFGASTTKAFAIDGFAGVGGDGAGSSQVLEDASGNLFVVGTTAGTIDVDPGTGTTLVGDGSTDPISFVAKYSATGQFQWAHDWDKSGPNEVYVYTADVGPGGYIVLGGEVAGSTGADLDPTSGVDTVTTTANDPFLLRINADGTYGWGSSFAVSGGGYGTARYVDVSSTGAIIAGISYSNTLTLLGTPITSAGNTDVAIVQFDATASTATWFSTVRGTGIEWVSSVDVSTSGTVYVSGGLTSSSVTVTGFDTAMTTVNRSGSATQNSYFASFSNTGITQYAVPRSIGAVDNSPRAVALSSSGTLLSQLDTGELVDVSSVGAITSKGTVSGNVSSMKYLSSGHVVAAGSFTAAADFDPSSGVVSRTPSGSADGFVLRLSSAVVFESLHVYSTSSTEELSSLSLTNSGGYLVSGRSFSTSLNLSNTENPGTYTRSASADSFMFVVHFDSNGTTGVPTTTTTTTVPAVSAPAVATYTTGNKKVTVKWGAVSAAASYVVSSSSGSTLCTSVTSSCVVPSLKNGKLYTLSVKSVNSAGVSSISATPVRVIPGFSLKTTTYKVKKSPLLTSIVSTPSKGIRKWQKVSGSCVISSARFLMPKSAGTCRVKLTVSKWSSYPAMSTTVTVTITK